MKSKFIGEEKLGIGKTYSRFDVGYANTQLALMQISEYEKIGFFNLGRKRVYDNSLTKRGFILNPRDDYNNEQFVAELNKCTTYLFLRNKNHGLYYYVGKSNTVKRLDDIHLLFKLDIKLIPDAIIKELLEK